MARVLGSNSHTLNSKRLPAAQVCWKWRKVVSDAPPGSVEMRRFLDTQQYSTAGILKYERVFGDGFVSTGGIDTTRVRIVTLQSEYLKALSMLEMMTRLCFCPSVRWWS